MPMKSVIQEEASGCGIASAAAIAGMPYQEAKLIANNLGIYAEDKALWSDTRYVRQLLDALGYSTGKEECPFKNWQSLPDCALLAIKWHTENGKAFWHWVVFKRAGDNDYVLDSKKALKNHIRKDFGRMKPKWYIEVIT